MHRARDRVQTSDMDATVPRDRARAALPAACTAVVDVYAEALSGLRAVADAEPGAPIDPLTAVAQLREATAALDAAEVDLLTVAVLAGAHPTPACHAVGIAPATLRRHLRELVA